MPNMVNASRTIRPLPCRQERGFPQELDDSLREISAVHGMHYISHSSAVVSIPGILKGLFLLYGKTVCTAGNAQHEHLRSLVLTSPRAVVACNVYGDCDFCLEGAQGPSFMEIVEKAFLKMQEFWNVHNGSLRRDEELRPQHLSVECSCG